MEKVVGDKLSEYCVCIPVTEGNYNEDTAGSLYEEENLKNGDYYVFEFFYDVDGIPWEEKGIGLEIQDSMKLAKDVSRVFNDQAVSADNFAQIISYGPDGIREIDLSRCYTTDDIYKQKQKILDVSEVLYKIKEYYDKIVLEGQIQIYDIHLIYTGYYSDINAEEVRNVVYPFWTVKYVDDNKELHQVLFDAYTGEMVK